MIWKMVVMVLTSSVLRLKIPIFHGYPPGNRSHIPPAEKRYSSTQKCPVVQDVSSYECFLVTVMGHVQVLPTKTRVTVRVKIGIPEPHGIHGTYDNSEKTPIMQRIQLIKLSKITQPTLL